MKADGLRTVQGQVGLESQPMRALEQQAPMTRAACHVALGANQRRNRLAPLSPLSSCLRLRLWTMETPSPPATYGLASEPYDYLSKSTQVSSLCVASTRILSLPSACTSCLSALNIVLVDPSADEMEAKRTPFSAIFLTRHQPTDHEAYIYLWSLEYIPRLFFRFLSCCTVPGMPSAISSRQGPTRSLPTCSACVLPHDWQRLGLLP